MQIQHHQPTGPAELQPICWQYFTELLIIYTSYGKRQPHHTFYFCFCSSSGVFFFFPTYLSCIISHVCAHYSNNRNIILLLFSIKFSIFLTEILCSRKCTSKTQSFKMFFSACDQDEVLEYVKDLCYNKIRPRISQFFKNLPDIPMK